MARILAEGARYDQRNSIYYDSEQGEKWILSLIVSGLKTLILTLTLPVTLLRPLKTYSI